MKKILISKSEKRQILNQHKNAGHNVNEQNDVTRMEPTEFNNIKVKVQDFVNNIDFNDTEKWQKTMSYLMESNRDAYNLLKSIGGRGESSIRSLVEILASMNAIYKSDEF